MSGFPSKKLELLPRILCLSNFCMMEVDFATDEYFLFLYKGELSDLMSPILKLGSLG